jgi:hypothetical protein
LVEHWQLGGIFSWISGAPLSITAPNGVITQATSTTTPNIAGDFPKNSGKVTKVANGVIYFPGTTQITDPSIASVSSLNALNGAFSNKAIADASGKLLLVNPAPGQLSNMGLKWIEGPPTLGFDMNMIKRVRITETKEFEVRVDAVNVLNHPIFGNPNTNINSVGSGTTTTFGNANDVAFGRITTAGGNRRFTVGARLNF